MRKIIIQEKFAFDREHKHSVRYKPAQGSTLAEGMSIYLPRMAIGKDQIPKSILVTIKD